MMEKGDFLARAILFIGCRHAQRDELYKLEIIIRLKESYETQVSVQ